MRALRGATPAQAINDEENPLLQFTQSEKAYETLRQSQNWADKKREELERDKAFRRPVQGTGYRKGPRKGDPNYDGVVESIDSKEDLQFGMIRKITAMSG